MLHVSLVLTCVNYMKCILNSHRLVIKALDQINLLVQVQATDMLTFILLFLRFEKIDSSFQTRCG